MLAKTAAMGNKKLQITNFREEIEYFMLNLRTEKLVVQVEDQRQLVIKSLPFCNKIMTGIL